MKLYLVADLPGLGVRILRKAVDLIATETVAGVLGHAAMFTILRRHFEGTHSCSALLPLVDLIR